MYKGHKYHNDADDNLFNMYIKFCSSYLPFLT